jgi:murein DD-endopeptidase MepM/ murein hydrolase activator NlpD
MMTSSAIVVDFPLRGEWVAASTPAERVPSHGTDMLGQRYAYDFMRIERLPKGWKYCHASGWRYNLRGAPLADCYAWGRPIYAPFAGSVVTTKDGWRERDPVHWLRDLAVVLMNGLTFYPGMPDGTRRLAGNHIILKMAGQNIYALIAHARTGSIRVQAGDEVRAGQHLADVGHSGNSTAPHLHFQLMDNADALKARGLPCVFKEYEALRGADWVKVSDGMPGKREFIRAGG